MKGREVRWLVGMVMDCASYRADVNLAEFRVNVDGSIVAIRSSRFRFERLRIIFHNTKYCLGWAKRAWWKVWVEFQALFNNVDFTVCTPNACFLTNHLLWLSKNLLIFIVCYWNMQWVKYVFRSRSLCDFNNIVAIMETDLNQMLLLIWWMMKSVGVVVVRKFESLIAEVF